MAAGFASTPGLIRCHYVRKEKGTDQITPVVERALALRDEGILVTADRSLVNALGPAPASP
jgi:DNA segregation ATPase FtsK/SpoIIIE, S-DNA-T family